MASAAHVRYRFGVFEVDPRAGEISKHGLKLRLRGRPFEMLVALLEHAGEVMTREELQARLWRADTTVDFDHGLNTSVNRLREILGDAAENPRFVETVPRRGYRFIAPVEVVAVPARVVSVLDVGPVAPAIAPPLEHSEPVVGAPTVLRAGESPAAAGPGFRARWLPWAGIATVVLAVLVSLLWLRGIRAAATPPEGRVMVAVLPFQDLSGAADDSHFSDGITEEMIAQLGALRPNRIGVIARTTVMQYRQSSKDVMEIGRELGVDYVLEGSVRRADTQVRITAKLVQVSDQTQLWAGSFDATLSNVLALQRSVASSIADTLAGEVLRGPDRMAMRAPVGFDAWEAYSRGRSFRERATVEDAYKGIAAFKKAIALDPKFALAYAGLADCYRLLAAPGWEAERPSGLLEPAHAATAEALALAPDLAEAYAARGMIRFTGDWDLDGADADLRRAVAINPSLAQAHHYRSSVLTAAGRTDEAIRAAQRARELDPLSATVNATLGIRYYYAGRYAEAREQLRGVTDVSPQFGVSYWGLAVTAYAEGHADEAVSSMRRAVELSGPSSYMRAWLGFFLGRAGHRADAEAVLASLERESQATYVSPFHFALVTLGLGRDEETISWLERAYDDGSGWMTFLRVQPEFAPLAGNPRFVKLVSRISAKPGSARETH